LINLLISVKLNIAIFLVNTIHGYVVLYACVSVCEAKGEFTLESMFNVLRHAEVETCPEGFIVASSQVSLLPRHSTGGASADPVSTHWLTATPVPSLSFFKPFVFTGAGELEGTTTKLGAEEEGHRLWVAHRGFRERLEGGEGRTGVARENVRQLEASCASDVDQLTGGTCSDPQATTSGAMAGPPSMPVSLFQHLVDLEINFY